MSETLDRSVRPGAGEVATLIAHLQSVGLKVVGDIGARSGGAGPADAGMLWSEGAPASVIAKELGKTRNAVLGKVDRLGLARHKFTQTITRVFKHKEKPPPSEPLPEPPPVQHVNGVTLMELQPRDCRWPLGDPRDPDLKFCGYGTLGDGPYCPRHHRKAHVRSSH